MCITTYSLPNNHSCFIAHFCQQSTLMMMLWLSHKNLGGYWLGYVGNGRVFLCMYVLCSNSMHICNTVEWISRKIRCLEYNALFWKNVNFSPAFCCTSEILMEELWSNRVFFFLSFFPSSIEFLIIRSHLSQSVSSSNVIQGINPFGS